MRFDGLAAEGVCVYHDVLESISSAPFIFSWEKKTRHSHVGPQADSESRTIIVTPYTFNISCFHGAMKTGQGGMDRFCFDEESTSSRRVILKIELRIKQPKLNLVTVGRDSSFSLYRVWLLH